MNIFNTNNFNYKEINGLTDELKCFYINELFKKENKSILIVTNTLFECDKFYQMLSNYNEKTLFFPMDDFVTSEVLAVSPEFKSIRLNTINKLLDNEKSIIVTNLMGFLRYLPPKDLFLTKFLKLEVGKEYDFKKIIDDLSNIGYEREVIINKSGQMAIRGYVIDVFPINESEPIRLEFWGDELESIRFFDINTQLTTKKINSVTIKSNTEFLTPSNDISDKQRNLINYIEPQNIQDFFKGITIYNDYEELQIANQNLQSEIIDYRDSNEIKEIISFMHDFDKFEYDINLGKFENLNDNTCNIESYSVEINYNNFKELNSILENYLKENKKVIICMNNRYQINNFIEQLDNKKTIFTNELEIFDKKINIIIKNINEGFMINDYVVISEKDLFKTKTNYNNYKSNFNIGTKIKDITKINVGDFVVHRIHGIGKYCGIKTITKNGLQKDYLQLEYKDNDKVYIPVEKIELINKYNLNEGYEPRLTKLGSVEWEKTKIRAQKKAHEMASELLNLYASRETIEGFAFNKDDENQINFEKEFIYQETMDQIKAIEEIKKDMESSHPMDRLLCGDVGYGKTEVAFRAAFKAILSGKQVALLCPTTILSNQHYQTALERFKNFPVNIELLNRFVSQKKANEIISDLKNGKVDFIIGTHKILNDKIKYKDLGLLIIDEEQRFGVVHKEKIKKYKNNIDVLTLSATPIPRTLQLSMSSIRSLSLIETPPKDRLPIQTYVVAKNNNLIKEVIYKELSRQGQVFLLYNRIDGIESKAWEIQNLVKEAKVAYAHGQMSKEELENIMNDFINHKYDVLVCTTIIESGIDIPNVNTLIVMGADNFGLSQLYQIRGRVGRSNKIGYCYLMYDQNKILTETATKRLKAIKEFTELGSGFSIAMRDLSIRGAGDILGSEQAGFIASVGIDLFMQMLNEEVLKLKGQYVLNEEIESQPLIDVNTFINNDYVADEQLKIIIHKKINEINSKEKLKEIKEELEDRFGKLNDDIIIYMHEQLFENLAHNLNIKKVNQTDKNIEIILEKEITSKIDGEKLFMDVLDISRDINFKMRSGYLSITLVLKNLQKHFIYYLIDLLEAIKKAI